MFLLLLKVLTLFGVSYWSFLDELTVRLGLSLATTWLIAYFAAPYFITKLYSLKIGQSIRKEECPLLWQLHKKKENTPTMGGILILFALFISLFLWMDLTAPFTWILLLATLGIGYLGGRDDYLKLKYKNAKGLSVRKKFLYQIVIAIIVVVLSAFFSDTPMAALYIPFKIDPIYLSKVILYPFMIFVIVGSCNAVNLSDGLDGLATGLTILAALPLTLVAVLSGSSDLASLFHLPYIAGSSEIAVYLIGLVGASIGFLWFNGYPASLFMGDTGSLSIGAILGVSAVLLREEFFFALVGFMFVVEALSVILQVASYRWRHKKRIFLCSPLHHHFEYKGWHEVKIVTRFWMVGLLCAILGVLSLKSW